MKTLSCTLPGCIKALVTKTPILTHSSSQSDLLSQELSPCEIKMLFGTFPMHLWRVLLFKTFNQMAHSANVSLISNDWRTYPLCLLTWHILSLISLCAYNSVSEELTSFCSSNFFSLLAVSRLYFFCVDIINTIYGFN